MGSYGKQENNIPTVLENSLVSPNWYFLFGIILKLSCLISCDVYVIEFILFSLH